MKKMVKNLIHKQDQLFMLYYKILYKPKDIISAFLDSYSKKLKDRLFFIQVGANDGRWDDPIYKFIRRDKWKGILIEPQKEIFNRLKENYKKARYLDFENLAIDNFEGERVLYKISFSSSQWASGISSFLKEDIEKLIDSGYVKRMASKTGELLPVDKNNWICEEIVKVTTLKRIVEKYRLTTVDLLMIDAEGYDYEIIKTIPFDIIQPKVIIYEHIHFDVQKKSACSCFLKSYNYSLTNDEFDTIAVSNN